MARRRSVHTEETPNHRYALLVPTQKAEEQLDEALKSYQGLLARTQAVRNESELADCKSERETLRSRSAEMLTRMFDADTVRNEFMEPAGGSYKLQPSFSDLIEYAARNLRRDITRLESVKSRLDLIPVSASVEEESELVPLIPRKQDHSKVFVVHGHDDGSKQAVARMLESLSLQPIILHEQASKGMTLAEKLDHYSDVGFAIVLLTPDDVGAAKASSDDLNPRARQNVVFELGLFIGKLGRDKVCALKKGDIEEPSDYKGVVYVPFDEHESWKYKLAKELREAGYQIDMNRV